MFGATFNLVTRVGLYTLIFGTLKDGTVFKLIVKHQTIVSFTETSSKMASTLCQNG